MRLGLVGTGPQAQRYLMPKNGGAHIVSQVPGRIGPAEYQDWLQGVDGVIIATHPRGHRHLALDAIAEGKHVLIEKPLALNLEDCEAIIDAADLAPVVFQVAHTYLWREDAQPLDYSDPTAIIRHGPHTRDYSVWLDWAPHAIALLAKQKDWPARKLALSVSLCPAEKDKRVFRVSGFDYLSPARCETQTPMWLMMRDFMLGNTASPEYLRRVYRALFAQENNATR